MTGLLADLGFLTTTPMWLAAGLLLCGGLLLAWPMIRRWLRSRRATAMNRRVPTIEERLHAVQAAATHRDELERLVAEARETIRLGCAQLDARLERLELLTADADRAAPRHEPRTETPIHVRSVHPAAPAQTAPLADPLTQQVYALADEGRSPMEIASQLDEHTGKVELMLALRRV